MDSDEAAAARDHRVWRAASEFVTSFRWQGYVILTFTYPTGPEAIQRHTTAWFACLQAEFPRVFAYVSADRGGATGHWNVHVLLGGVFDGAPPAQPFYRFGVRRALATAERLWTRGLVAKAVRYDPRGHMAAYLTQPTTWVEPDVPGTFLGQPIRKSHGRRRP